MAANYREYNQEQVYLVVINPDAIKRNNPLLLAIDSFIEEHVSIEPFSKKVKNDSGGAPAVQPKMMLKIIFYSYATGIYSSREIEERLRWDQNYIYLSGNQKVDHSTICNFILDYEEEIAEIFSILVYVMAEMGYVTLEFVATDGAKIRANASKWKFTGTPEDFKKKRKEIEEKINKLLNQTTSEKFNKKHKEKYSDKLNALQREKAKIDAFLAEIKTQKNSENEPQIVNLTDRDACMVKDKDITYMGYNCQIGVDSENHVIVSEDVFNEPVDNGLLQPMIEKTKEQAKQDLDHIEFGFDAGYYSSENLQYCEDNKLKVYLPEGKDGSGTKQRNPKTIESRDCKLEIDGTIKRLTCPGGQVMEASKAIESRGISRYYFRPRKEYCKFCQHKDKCYKNVKSRKIFTIKKEYLDTLHLREQMIKKLSTPKGKRRMRERFCIVEHVFGEIKELYNFKKFMHRGKRKVKLIWCIVCTAYNFRKLARLAYGS